MKLSAYVRSILAVILLGLSAAAHADDWGCQVLLCLSNPSGPEALSQCEPPIEKLWKALSKTPPDPFPSCGMAVNPATGARSYAQPGYSWFDLCPTGTTPLPQGQLAVLGGSQTQPSDRPTVYVGVGDGNSLDGSPPAAGSYPSQIVCVGNRTGTTEIPIDYGGASFGVPWRLVPVGVYDQLVLLDAQSSPRVIDVYVDDALVRRVRW